MKVLPLAALTVLLGNGGMAAAQQLPVHIRTLHGPGGEPVHARAYLRRDGQLVQADGPLGIISASSCQSSSTRRSPADPLRRNHVYFK